MKGRGSRVNLQQKKKRGRQRTAATNGAVAGKRTNRSEESRDILSGIIRGILDGSRGSWSPRGFVGLKLTLCMSKVKKIHTRGGIVADERKNYVGTRKRRRALKRTVRGKAKLLT